MGSEGIEVEFNEDTQKFEDVKDAPVYSSEVELNIPIDKTWYTLPQIIIDEENSK